MRVVVFIALLVYGAFLLAMTKVITSRGTEPDSEFFAAAPLPFNHLIVDKDLLAVSSDRATAARPTKEAPAPAKNDLSAPDAKRTSPESADKSVAQATDDTRRAAPDTRDPRKTARFVGKYTSGTVGQRQLLREWELTSTPTLSPPDAAVRMLLPVIATDITIGKINAGSSFCIGMRPVKVVTVICASGITAPCNAVIDLAPADAEKFTKVIASGKAVLQPPSANNKCD